MSYIYISKSCYLKPWQMKKLFLLWAAALVLVGCRHRTEIYYCGNPDSEVYELLVNDGFSVKTYDEQEAAIEA